MNQQTKLEKMPSPTAFDRSLPLGKVPEGNTDIWIGCWPNIPYLRVYWHASARLQVLAHCYETPDIEVGGVLLGKVFRTRNPADYVPMDVIEAHAAIRARFTNSGVGYLQFTQDTWADINNVRDNDPRCSQHQIIGWYHTHPGHGLFLSGHDLFIQGNFFNQEYQLALVIETHERRGVFFVSMKEARNEEATKPYRSETFSWDHGLLLGILSRNEDIRQMPPATMRNEKGITDIEILDEELSANIDTHPHKSLSVAQAQTLSSDQEQLIKGLLLGVFSSSILFLSVILLQSQLQAGYEFIINWFREQGSSGTLVIIIVIIILIAVGIGVVLYQIMPTTPLQNHIRGRRDGRDRNNYHRRR